MSETPILFIVGSASERLAQENSYEPPVTDFEAARCAARDIGRQAAIKGWHLQVYSLHEDFIEHEFVRGYAVPDAGDPADKKIYVHFAQGHDAHDPISEARQLFDCHFEGVPYPDERWEVAFYRPLRSASAVVVLGGGRATLTTGIVALAQRIPLYAVATFGGSGRVVWQATEVGQDLPDDPQRRLMGNSWLGNESAEKCLLALEEQIKARTAEINSKLDTEEKRRQQEEELAAEIVREDAEIRQQKAEEGERLRQARAQRIALTLHCLVGLTSLMVTLFCVSQWQTTHPSFEPLVSILLGAVAAGITGSSILGIIRWRTPSAEPPSFYSEVATLVPGATAGFVASLIFVLGQVVTLPDGVAGEVKAEQLRRMIPFVAVVGLVAGLTWNRFFSRLSETNLPTGVPGSKSS